PHGPQGNRGYFTGVSSMLVGSRTKHAQEAFDCAAYIASKEWSKRAFVEQGQPPARKSVWAMTDQLGVHPIWKRVGDWMLEEAMPGNFPMPYNLRYQELNDKFVNSHLPLWYGEVPFEEGVQKIHSELESIVTLPRE
ncbi:MAG: hypothetical protein H5T69_14780, partial [Chloroflexi bacterium]|nr:hypothetical protein [Chloroflexota bacterium]